MKFLDLWLSGYIQENYVAQAEQVLKPPPERGEEEKDTAAEPWMARDSGTAA